MRNGESESCYPVVDCPLPIVRKIPVQTGEVNNYDNNKKKESIVK